MPTPLPCAFWPVTITAGVNDQFSFNGGAATMTVAPGTYYSMRDLLDAIAAACGSGYPSATHCWFLWPTATNLLESVSETLSSWSAVNVTLAQNVRMQPYGPGSNTADSMQEQTTTGYHGVTRLIDASNVTRFSPSTFSVFLRPQVQTTWTLRMNMGTTQQVCGATFTLSGAGSVASISGADSARVVYIGDGFYRIEITFTPNESADLSSLIQPELWSGIYESRAGNATYLTYVWGWKLESGMRSTHFKPAAMAAGTPGRVGYYSALVNTIDFGLSGSYDFADLLGFKRQNLSGASSYAATYQHQNGWYADVPVRFDSRERYDRLVAGEVSHAGRIRTVSFGDPRESRAVELGFLKPWKAKIAREGSYRNEAIERLWRDAYSRFRWWPDAAVGGVYVDYALDPRDLVDFNPARERGAQERYALGWTFRRYV